LIIQSNKSFTRQAGLSDFIRIESGKTGEKTKQKIACQIPLYLSSRKQNGYFQLAGLLARSVVDAFPD
jgi:hypothetical protein